MAQRRVVGKVLTIEKQIEKLVHVDRPVVTEKLVPVDRPVYNEVVKEVPVIKEVKATLDDSVSNMLLSMIKQIGNGGGMPPIAIEHLEHLSANSDTMLERGMLVASESLVKGTVTHSTSGDQDVYTPAEGKKIRLYFFGYSAGADVTNQLLGLKLEGYNSSAVFDQQYLTAAGQPYARNIQGGKRYIEGAVDGKLIINLSASQTVYINYELEEV